MLSRAVTVIAIFALVGGCSTRPREFRADIAASPPEARNFDADMRQCQVMVRQGVKKDFKRTAAQVALGTGGGIAIGGAVASAAAANATTLSGAFGAMGAGAAAMTVAGPLIGFGVSRMIRTGREKKYRAALEACLGEYGYQVAGWKKQKKLTKAEIADAVAAMQADDDTPVALPAPETEKTTEQPTPSTSSTSAQPLASPPAFS
jgi:hypothetical protein